MVCFIIIILLNNHILIRLDLSADVFSSKNGMLSCNSWN